MASDPQETPTKAEVRAHMRGIHPRYRRCKRGDHNFQMTYHQAYRASGDKFRGSDLRNAAWFDCTDTCIVDGNNERGCGRERFYQMEWDPIEQELVRTTDYSYDHMHPDLKSPKGISRTGINVRSAMPDLEREETIRRAMMKNANAKKGAA